MKKLIPITPRVLWIQTWCRKASESHGLFSEQGILRRKGDHGLQRQPDRTLLVYKIDRGAKHKVDRISFHGNYGIRAKELGGSRRGQTLAHLVARQH